jgi:putative PIN family toxin of toxin-antitoxin system
VLRVVLDTNVFVSGLLSKTGLPAKMLDAWRAGQYLLITSPPIITEIKRVLEAPRIREKYFITNGDIEELIILLEKDALIVPGHTDVKNAIPDDPSDEMFLACAMDASADFIVSGDRHLLDISQYKGIPIIAVNEFEEKLARSS